MTVSYQYEVASSTSGGFTRLLFMWRGSLYKLIYRELALFLLIFGAISAVYRNLLDAEQRKSFEKIVVYCDTFINLIPLSFVLGFYVAYVASRWWQQYMAIPWPDKVMHSLALYVIGSDEYGRMVKRALMRYLNLSLILVLRSISSAVKRRFPTLDHVVDAGFMTHLELDLFVSVPSIEFNTYWIPCTWFINLLKEARSNHRLPDPMGLKIIMEEFNEFRAKCGLLWSYDWVSIPLVYTQVVTLATYSFFAVALVGRQYIENADDNKPGKAMQMKGDIYVPAFTVLQFFFYMGLLKVAEQLINPFGDDDEDFELNWLIDRHTKVSYLGVDTLMNRCPPLVKDIYYDTEDLVLPYTEAAAAYKRKTYRGSVAHMTVPEAKQTMFLPNILEDDENASEGLTPRTSSSNLALHADNFSGGDRRQGSRPPRSGEAVLTLEEPTEPGKSNGRSSGTVITDAMKMFVARNRLLDRKPFLGASKPSKVSIQPWPSATNLGADSLERLDAEPARPFHVPTIEVRQSSVDAGPGSLEMAERQPSPARPHAGAVNRGFLFREQRSLEEAPSPFYSGEGAAASGAPRAPSAKAKGRSKASRFHSFPKFLARRQRAGAQRAARRSEAPPCGGLTVCRSSPELRVDLQLATSSSSERVRAKFFAGNDDESEADSEAKS